MGSLAGLKRMAATHKRVALDNARDRLNLECTVFDHPAEEPSSNPTRWALGQVGPVAGGAQTHQIFEVPRPLRPMVAPPACGGYDSSSADDRTIWDTVAAAGRQEQPPDRYRAASFRQQEPARW